MKIIIVLLLLLGSVWATDQTVKCLLQEHLTNQCIEAISGLPLQSQIGPYLCTIALEKSLLTKAQEFCRNAIWDEDSGFNYLRSLLLQHKFKQALEVQYKLFFRNPFAHTSSLVEAIEKTVPSLPTDDDTIHEWTDLDQAIYYFYTNQTQISLKKLKKHISSSKERDELIYEHFLMVRLLQKTQQYYDALNYITEVLKKNKKDHFYFHHLRGNLLMHHVQFQQALLSFQFANRMYQSSQQSGFSFSHYNAGLCHEKMGNVEEAIKSYQKSYLSYQSAEALNALGHASYSLYQQSEDVKYLEKAEMYYNKALKKNEKYTVLIFNLGILKLAQNKIAQAIDFFARCLSMDKNLQSCKYGLLKAYFIDNQIEKATQIVNGLQKTEQTLVDLLAIHYELGYHEKALALLVKGKVYRSSELLKWKGYNEYALDKFAEAEQSLSQAIKAGGNDAYTYTALGETQLLLRKYMDCVNSLEHAYRLDNRQQTKELLEECKKLLNNSEL